MLNIVVEIAYAASTGRNYNNKVYPSKVPVFLFSIDKNSKFNAFVAPYYLLQLYLKLNSRFLQAYDFVQLFKFRLISSSIFSKFSYGTETIVVRIKKRNKIDAG